jgi:hypothetical protein
MGDWIASQARNDGRGNGACPIVGVVAVDEYCFFISDCIFMCVCSRGEKFFAPTIRNAGTLRGAGTKKPRPVVKTGSSIRICENKMFPLPFSTERAGGL